MIILVRDLASGFDREHVLRQTIRMIRAARELAVPIVLSEQYREGLGATDAAILTAAGDVPIVEYFDYECPYCRKLEPELRQVVFDDGKVRLIWKDWPILGPMSIVATKMVLASRYQNKFIQAHDALMGLNSMLTASRINEVLAGTGVDMDRLKRDLATHEASIRAVVMRNNDQATAFGFKGTPSFIVGKFRVPGVLTMEEFGQVIADARKAAAERK